MKKKEESNDRLKVIQNKRKKKKSNDIVKVNEKERKKENYYRGK